jgi:hypothetical protein
MKSRNARILDWAIKKVETDYPNDVCLLVVYGSFINRTDGPMSDVDFYYVPASDRAGELCRTFIVEGIGYDLFPMSWERVGGLAMLDEPLLPLLGDSEIAYCRSDDDRKRLGALRATLRRNLADAAFMHRKAVDAFSRALGDRSKLAATDDLCGRLLLAGGILLRLADAVAYENQTYYHHGLKAKFGDLRTMRRLPDGFLDGYLSVVGARTASQIEEACAALIGATGAFLGCDVTAAGHPIEPDAPEQEPQAIDFRQLAEDYGETISTFNKVYSACNSGDATLAFISAVCLQEPLSDVFPGIDLDVLSAYDAADLRRYADHVRDVEAELVAYIESGAPITRYASVDEFLSRN